MKTDNAVLYINFTLMNVHAAVRDAIGKAQFTVRKPTKQMQTQKKVKCTLKDRSSPPMPTLLHMISSKAVNTKFRKATISKNLIGSAAIVTTPRGTSGIRTACMSFSSRSDPLIGSNSGCAAHKKSLKPMPCPSPTRGRIGR